MVYGLGRRGAQALAEHRGAAATDTDWTERNKRAGASFIGHTLAVAHFMVGERNVVVKDAQNNVISMSFNGSDYESVDFDLKIDVGPSSQFSESLAMASLDKFYDNKEIDINMYIELAPDNVIPFKQKLKNLLKEKSEREQQQMFQKIIKVMASLTPEEQAAVQQNPELLNQLIGGGANGQMSKMPNTATG
jgi:hypothetical protein